MASDDSNGSGSNSRADVSGSGSSNSDASTATGAQTKPPIFLSNNFDNYWKMKTHQPEPRDDGDGHNNTNTTQARDKEWNHLTAPLTTVSDTAKDTWAPESKSSEAGAAAARPSIFSDLERGQTVDRFANVFMETISNAISSQKLSKAWKDGGGSVFSWLTTDYSPSAAAANVGNSKDNNQEQVNMNINPKDYAAERNMIEPHLTPMVWGGSCMMVTLFSIRLGRWYQSRNAPAVGRGINKARQAASSTQRSSANTNIQSLQDARYAKPNHQHPNPFKNNPRDEFKAELMSSLQTLPVDMALSMLFGISTTIFLTNPKEILKDISTAPLLPQKSALAEELCIPLHNEMMEVNQQIYRYTTSRNNSADGTPGQRYEVPYSELWKDENLGNFNTLRAVRDFVSNCHERERVAKQIILAENKTDDDDGFVNDKEDDVRRSVQELLEVKIPPPGISPAALDYNEADEIAADNAW